MNLAHRPHVGQPRTRRLIAIVTVLVLVAVALWLAIGRSGSSSAKAAAATRARTLDAAFLRDWVDPDGRVVRRDQGADSVSEGQAYGMLLAVAVGDRSKFDSIWSWTKTYLQTSDSLLAWRWTNGAVADAQPASDADLDAATALLMAAKRFSDARYGTAGKAIAAAALRHETVPTTSGALLAAGPWATAPTAVINPSYLVGGTALMLARLTGDTGWNSVAAATRGLDAAVLGHSTLPPDWVSLQRGSALSSVQATGAPDGSAPPRYGLDAPRLLIRLAASCDAADRALAAQMTGKLGGTGEPAIRSLTGHPTVTWQHPITDVALSAVQTADGDRSAAQATLAAAQSVLQTASTYYGAVWLALGTTLLTTGLLSDCT